MAGKSFALKYAEALWPVSSDCIDPLWIDNYTEHWNLGWTSHSHMVFSIFIKCILPEGKWGGFSILCHFQQRENLGSKICSPISTGQCQISGQSGQCQISLQPRGTTLKIWAMKGSLGYTVIYLWSVIYLLVSSKDGLNKLNPSTGLRRRKQFSFILYFLNQHMKPNS